MSVVDPTRPTARRGSASAPVHTDRVSVIVLNWNGESDTAACLDSFLAQRDVRVEILLVDNASTDGSGERLRERYPMVSYLQTGVNLGYSGGNNRGIEWALSRGADWVLVVNNDTIADPHCVRSLLSASASDQRLAAVAPLIARYDDPTRVWFAGGHFDRIRAVGVHQHMNAPVAALGASGTTRGAPHWRTSTFLTGCCLLLRPAALREVGLFREDFFAYGEDLELSLRLRAKGWQVGWVPAALIAHRVPPYGAEPTPAQILLRDRNRRRLVRMHYARGWRIVFLLWFWPTRLVHLARYLLRGDRRRARAILDGMRAL